MDTKKCSDDSIDKMCSGLMLFKTTEIIQAISVSADGTVYYSTNEGLYKYVKKRITTILQNPTLGIRGIIQMKNKLYMTDINNHHILEYSLDTGKYSRLAGSSKGHQDGHFNRAQFRAPWGIALDSDNNLIITNDHSIRKLDLTQEQVTTIAGSYYGNSDGAPLSAQFCCPSGLAIDGDGTIYVSDCLNSSFRQIRDDLVSTPLKNVRFTRPRGVAVGMDGAVYVTDDDGLRIINFKEGKVTTRRGSHKCVASDRFGDIYLGQPDGVLKLNFTWKKERLLWIAFLKEDTSLCEIARLPKDLVKVIILFFKMPQRKAPPKPKPKAQQIYGPEIVGFDDLGL